MIHPRSICDPPIHKLTIGECIVGEKLKAEEGDKSAPDVFLNEIDLAIESIDLIVTPTLLHHIVELSRPLHILDLQALTPEPELEPEVYQTLNSNHSLPLVFASTKNLRLFLVSDEKVNLIISIISDCNLFNQNSV